MQARALQGAQTPLEEGRLHDLAAFVESFTQEQLLWTSGYLAGLAVARVGHVSGEHAALHRSSQLDADKPESGRIYYDRIIHSVSNGFGGTETLLS